jgi:hypothetical protein
VDEGPRLARSTVEVFEREALCQHNQPPSNKAVLIPQPMGVNQLMMSASIARCCLLAVGPLGMSTDPLQLCCS